MSIVSLAVHQLEPPLHSLPPAADDGLLVALGRRNIAYAGDEKYDITTCPPEGWNYFGPTKTKVHGNTSSKGTHLDADGEQATIVSANNVQSISSIDIKNETLPDISQDDIISNSNFSPKELNNDQASAHRPTTLKIMTNSNDSGDDDACKASNDPCSQDKEPNDTVACNSEKPTSIRRIVTAGGRQDSFGDGVEGAVAVVRSSGNTQDNSTRPERTPRTAPRMATLVKVRVEKRVVGSHGRSERSHANNDQTVREQTNVLFNVENRAASVEEELADLMAEVKAATSQIKQEVKQIRQSDTPTPDTPTPLREFRDFLNKEEEQELERLPTITELQRENEDDNSNLVASGEVTKTFQSPCCNHSKYSDKNVEEFTSHVCNNSCNCNRNLFSASHSKLRAEGLDPNTFCTKTSKHSTLEGKDLDTRRKSRIKNNWWKVIKECSQESSNSKPINSDKLVNESIDDTCNSNDLFDVNDLSDNGKSCKVGADVLLDTVIAGIDSIIALLQSNIISGRDVTAFMSPILKRIEVYENEIKHASFFSCG